MKRLIICADGTWDKVDRIDPEREKATHMSKPARNPTNVVKISRAILPRSADGIDQVVYYDEGVGTGFGLLDPVLGGMFGIGLSNNVIKCYRFLVNNYCEGDELYLFGFSRGAYTVRSLAGLIGKIGILTKRDAYYIPEAYDCYRLRTYRGRNEIEDAISGSIPRWLPASIRNPLEEQKRAQLTEIAKANREKVALFAEGKYKDPKTGLPAKFRKRNQPTHMADIKFIGVWDTVGALGVPFDVAPFKWINNRVAFHNVELGERVQYAYHALAIDEKRRPFRATLWDKEKRDGQTVEQVWFAGYHSNVGGGLFPSYIENFAFRWMVEKAAGAGLAIDDKFMSFYREKEGDLDYALRDSMSAVWRPLGVYERPINQGEFTYESVHPSAEQRMQLAHPHEGSKEKWPYQPANLIAYLEAMNKRNDNNAG